MLLFLIIILGKISRISSFEKKIKFISGDIRDRKKVFSSLKKLMQLFILHILMAQNFFTKNQKQF